MISTTNHLKFSSPLALPLQQLKHALTTLRYHTHTLYLFTRNDIKTMLIPLSALGILTSLPGPPMTSHPTSCPTILSNLPALLLWLWLNILILSVSNQRDPAGVLEDKLNKPWRPIPAGRVSAAQARHLLLAAVPLALALSFRLGVGSETLACICASSYYNDLGGADEHFLIRQLVNGLAYPVYGVAALKILIADAGVAEILPGAYAWLGLLGLVVGTTIQVQDLKDYEGDKARRRHTFPVILGDAFTRFGICVGIMFWSLVCPAFWGIVQVRVAGWVWLSGALLAARIWCRRGPEADRLSFVMWSWWVMGLFVLPLMRVA
ncbi:Fumagillin beta-trans-bergamotene synthase [Colletotrichum viniferum]|nr:Fumagillin beta-trans-bergamotene synthase [Colletotrichum viniferum]